MFFQEIFQNENAQRPPQFNEKLYKLKKKNKRGGSGVGGPGGPGLGVRGWEILGLGGSEAGGPRGLGLGFRVQGLGSGFRVGVWSLGILGGNLEILEGHRKFWSTPILTKLVFGQTWFGQTWSGQIWS